MMEFFFTIPLTHLESGKAYLLSSRRDGKLLC